LAELSQIRLRLDTPIDWFSRKFLHLSQIILAPGPETRYITSDAEVVELVDTLCSGRSVRKDMWVQIPPSAPIHIEANPPLFIAYFTDVHFLDENTPCKKGILSYIEIVTDLGAGLTSFEVTLIGCHF
jgi:hypothetical protein